MKKHLSLALLTLSIFSINLLPARATSEKLENSSETSESVVYGGGQWCVQVPWMGIFCWDL